MRIARVEFKLSRYQLNDLFGSRAPAIDHKERVPAEKTDLDEHKEKETLPSQTALRADTESQERLNTISIEKLWEDKKLAWDKHAEAEGRKLAYQWEKDKRALEEVFCFYIWFVVITKYQLFR